MVVKVVGQRFEYMLYGREDNFTFQKEESGFRSKR